VEPWISGVSAIVGVIVGGVIGAVVTVKVKHMEIRAQSSQWKLERRDAAYSLLAQWLGENWVWVRTQHEARADSPESIEPRHGNHLQTEAMLRLHCSTEVNALIDSYSDAWVELLYATQILRAPTAVSGTGADGQIGRVQTAQEAVWQAGEAITKQMAYELDPNPASR
jgi:hypothetical protein